jgi:mRNA interferase RelE/StbE
MYEVYLERAAERDLNRLATADFERAIVRIRSLSDNPRPPGSRKMVGSVSDWRVRVGNLRIIYGVDDDEGCVRVMRVGHRGAVYR